jgi:hypothetical protein
MMAYSIEKVEVWSGVISDVPGGMAAKLGPLAAAGANLEFVLARRDHVLGGVIFVAPLSGAALVKAAKQLGLAKSDELAALRVIGPDKAGLGAKLTASLAGAGINVRGMSAMALAKKSVVMLAFDTKQDAVKAKRLLEKAL